MEFSVTVGVSASIETKADLPCAPYVGFPSWVSKSFVARIRALNCFETVRAMLIGGMPGVEVARHIQSLNELTDLKLESVRQMVEHFKATLPKGLMMARMNPNHYVETKKKVEAQVDLVAECKYLFDLQKKRIEILMKREEGIGFLLTGGEKNFSEARELLRQMADLTKMMGVTNAQAGEAMEQMAKSKDVNWSQLYSKPQMNEVMADPQSRARLVRFAENLATMYGRMSPEQQQKVMEAAAKREVKDVPSESASIGT
jgi:hypothetical protein